MGADVVSRGGFYRMGAPGEDVIVHLNFGSKRPPANCVSPKMPLDSAPGDRCGRPCEALCDAVVGSDHGKEETCDAPMCALHRTRAGAQDYCPAHVKARSDAFEWSDPT
jgi:hypothetical protein